jgi:polysaccharide pyruvyl transferase WcaK-like protein
LKRGSGRNRIGLLGPFSYGNLGNAALQQTLVQEFTKRFANAQFYGCCIDPDEPADVRKVIPFPIDRHVPWPGTSGSLALNRFKKDDPQRNLSAVRQLIKRMPLLADVWSAARSSLRKAREIREELIFCFEARRFVKEFQLLVVGLGGVFDEVWGGKWGDLYSIFRWSVLARLAGTPVVYLSVGVEEINSRLGKFFCKSALSVAAYRSFRDEESKRKVEAIGVTGENFVFPDLAFGLEHTNSCGTAAEHEASKTVGVSPMAYCDPRFWPVKNLPVYQEYLKRLSGFVSWLMRRGYDVVLFPTQIRMDRIAVEELKALVLAEVPNELRSRLRDAPLHSVDECLALLSRVRAVVTSRLHGVILSSLANTPVLAISPASKIDRLMEDMGLTDYLLNIRQIELTLLTERFQRLEANREIIRREMRRGVTRNRFAVESQFDLLFRPSGPLQL